MAALLRQIRCKQGLITAVKLQEPLQSAHGLADNNLFALQAHLQAPRCSPVKPAQIALNPFAESLPVLGHAHQAVLEIVREIPCRESKI